MMPHWTTDFTDFYKVSPKTRSCLVTNETLTSAEISSALTWLLVCCIYTSDEP